MANFRYDNDMLLKKEITGAGIYEGSYSHFNGNLFKFMS